MKMTTLQSDPQDGLPNVEGLPKSFVESMRTLFDIMDDQNTGYVKFTEIERRWHEDGTQGLPQGVLNSLRKVTPPSGLLTFERFCGGLKMSLLKSQGKLDQGNSAFSNIRSSGTLSPTNSLEAIGPLTASSPQNSPQHRNRPLSAPLLDQEPYHKQPMGNVNLFNSGTTSSRKSSGFFHQKAEKTLYHTEYPSQSHIPLKIHKQQVDLNKIYATKSDIRMGIGGIKGIFKGSSNNAQNHYGPPKPPRTLEGEIYAPTLKSKSYHSSLERESRSDKRWNDQREIISSKTGTAKRSSRGGSLERLLDSDNHRSKEQPYGPPQSRTGVRSAIQSWFKEKSKSDLNRGDTNNNYRNKRLQENIYKETRVLKKYPAMEYRGAGDGGDMTRTKTAFIPPPAVGLPLITRGSHLPLSTHVPKPPTKIADKNIYGKVTMEKAIPVNYNGLPNSRNENDSQPVFVAPGIYVAPQPPQVAVHKKTNKKKEPRRHTLQNGIDQNVMKKLRQLEAERDMLYQGLDVVEKAKNWYKQQLQGITERMHYLPFGQNKPEPNMELQREKLHFQLARIHEINAHLRALMDASDKGLPTHMNLAIRNSQDPLDLSRDSLAVDRLKQQNKLLTDEVSGKSEKITGLEREKAALLRELFQARSKQRLNADSTFM